MTTGNGAESWAERFRRATDEDPEIQAHGKFFTCSYLLDMEGQRFVVHMDRGKVAGIVGNPGPLDERYQFAIRASADTWRRFAQPTPPPMYHGIWAASFQRDMRLEGDLLVMMQNLRTLTRQLELLRQTGVPV
ncbi:MAG TPA: hypothetical protein VIO14_14025 [Dehalococcoidia bacterium]